MPGLRPRSLCLCCLGARDISSVTVVLLISTVLVISCRHYFYKIETKAFCSLLGDSQVVRPLCRLGLHCVCITWSLRICNVLVSLFTVWIFSIVYFCAHGRLAAWPPPWIPPPACPDLWLCRRSRLLLARIWRFNLELHKFFKRWQSVEGFACWNWTLTLWWWGEWLNLPHQ